MSVDPGQALRDQLAVTSPEKIEFIKMLIFAESGAGKTTFLGTTQDSELTMPSFIIDAEGGCVVLNDKPNLDVKQVRSTNQVQEIADILHQHKKYYKVISLDGFSELRDINMTEVMKQQFDRKPETTDIHVPSPREWGKSGSALKEILRYLKDLPCHVIVTCLQTEKKDESTGIVKIGPMLPGQLGGQVPGFFDVVGHLRATTKNGETRRTIQFKKTERVMAKDRTKCLPDTLDEPTLPAIWDIIFKAGATIDRTIAPELEAVVAQATPTVATVK